MTSAEWISCSACHELLCSRAFIFIVLRSAQHPQIPRFLQIFRGIWPMPLSLLNHSALALFAQRTRIPTSARSIGFCAIWVCISSSSCPSGHGIDDSGPKWPALPCSECAGQKNSFRPQRRGLQRSLAGDPEEESPISERLRDLICMQTFARTRLWLLKSRCCRVPCVCEPFPKRRGPR